MNSCVSGTVKVISLFGRIDMLVRVNESSISVVLARACSFLETETYEKVTGSSTLKSSIVEMPSAIWPPKLSLIPMVTRAFNCWTRLRL